MKGIKTAAVICHARFLDLASFGEILGQKGYDVRYYDAGQDSLSLDGEPDVLISLGGPACAYQRLVASVSLPSRTTPRLRSRRLCGPM
jgi:hypothetical protein